MSDPTYCEQCGGDPRRTENREQHQAHGEPQESAPPAPATDIEELLR